MIKFDINKIEVQNVFITAISEALGGSIRIVDQIQSDLEDCIKTKRFEIPYAVARAYKKKHKHTKYLVPIEVAITYYDGIIVNVEKRSFEALTNEDGTWASRSDYCVRRILPDVVTDNSWYTDSINIYQVPNNWNDHTKHDALTNDGRFYGVTVNAIKFSNFNVFSLIENPATRSCVAFTVNNHVILSPPIWTNVMDMRGNKISRQTDNIDDEKEETDKRFNVLDEHYFVNLEFVLTAAKKLGSLFGYQHIAFLELHRHMIALNTVNLPKIPRAIRSTYDTQKSFIVCLAWLFGYLDRSQDLQQYVAIRGLIKSLCNNGLFDRKSTEALLKVKPPEELNKLQALTNAHTDYSKTQISAYFMNKGVMKTESPSDIQQLLAGSTD